MEWLKFIEHPEILLIPLLMFSDYYLTIAASILKDKKYSDHYKIDNYELNPVWKNDIADRKIFNLKHIVIVFSFTVYLLFVFKYLEWALKSDYLAKLLIGFLFVVFGLLIGRHVANILIFYQAMREPDQLIGEVTMKNPLILYWSAYQYLGFGIPLGLLMLLSPGPYILGGLIGVVSLALFHFVWIRKWNKQRVAQSE